MSVENGNYIFLPFDSKRYFYYSKIYSGSLCNIIKMII